MKTNTHYYDYETLEEIILKAKVRAHLQDHLRIYEANGGKIQRIEKLTFDQLCMRWKSQKKNWSKNGSDRTIAEGVSA